MFGIGPKDLGKRAMMRGFFYVVLVLFAMFVAVVNANTLVSLSTTWAVVVTLTCFFVGMFEYFGSYKHVREMLDTVERKEKEITEKEREIVAKAQKVVIDSVLKDLEGRYVVERTAGPEFHILNVYPRSLQKEEPPQLPAKAPVTSQEP